jgi:hypothetical protein
MGIGTLACFVGECNLGQGRHSYYLSQEAKNKMSEWQFYHSIWVMLGISFCKLSIGAVLLRFVTNKTYKYVIWAMISTFHAGQQIEREESFANRL